MQEQLLEGLRERLGEEAPQQFALPCERRSGLVTFYRDLQDFFNAMQRRSRGRNWYPYVNSNFDPDQARRERQAVGVFCETRKGPVA